MKEIVSNGENGLLSPPGDADDLASKLISLIRNKQLRRTIVENGIRASQKHDIKNVAATISNIYERALTADVDPVLM